MSLHYPDFLENAQSLSASEIAEFGDRRVGFYRNVVKRIIDVALVALTVPFVLPLILILAALVSLDGHRPFYTQKRVGLGGRMFTMWKLRTMVPNAKQALEAYLASDPAARKEWDNTQKLKRDPRITKIGRFLRKSSADELPQLWNVLIGDMSLVGPRPMMPEQQPMYPGMAYYALRPGITGTWQISDRNQSSFAARAEFDSAYDKSVSAMTDLLILYSTVRVVVHGTGF